LVEVICWTVLGLLLYVVVPTVRSMSFSELGAVL
jgi:hypothetical protein